MKTHPTNPLKNIIVILAYARGFTRVNFSDGTTEKVYYYVLINFLCGKFQPNPFGHFLSERVLYIYPIIHPSFYTHIHETRH